MGHFVYYEVLEWLRISKYFESFCLIYLQNNQTDHIFIKYFIFL
jgi:hypothetical protein